MKLTLQILDSGEPYFLPLEDHPLVVGSDPSADLRLTAADVAPRHARIEPESGGSCRIVDLGSDHGTRVNGEDVAQWRLSIGDRIEIGSAVLVVGQRIERKATADDVLADDAGLGAGAADARRAALRRRSSAAPGRVKRVASIGALVVIVVAALFALSRGGSDSLPTRWGDLVAARRMAQIGEGKALIAMFRAEWAGDDAARAARLDAMERDLDAIEAGLKDGRQRVRAEAAGRTRVEQFEELQAIRRADETSVAGIVARVLLAELADLRYGISQSVAFDEPGSGPADATAPRPTPQTADPAGAGAGAAPTPSVAVGPTPSADAPNATAQRAPNPAEQTVSTANGEAERFVREQIAAVEQLRAAGRYAQALETAALAESATADAYAEPLRELRIRLRAETDRQMRAIVDRARELVRGGSPEDFDRGIALLREEGLRFPTDGEFGRIVDELRGFEADRAESVRRAGLAEAGAVSTSAPKLAELRDQLAEARRVERGGDFAGAARIVGAAAEALRTADPGYALSLDGRRQDLVLLDALVGYCRSEIAAGREVVLEDAERGAGPVASSGAELTFGDEPLSWSSITPASVAALLERGRPDGAAVLGGAVLAYRAGDRDRAEALLARAVKRDAALQPQIDGVLSRGRGETVDATGYRLVDGQFVAVRELEAKKHAKELERVVARIAKMPRDRRDAELEQILSKGPQELDALVLALKAEAMRSATRIESDPFRRHWENVAKIREQLDRARSFAKELIFDEVKYFYPYQPPAVTSEKAAEYWKVQTEVDERVAKVRALWETEGPSKRVPKKLLDEVALLDWHLEVLTGFAERLPELEERVAWARSVPRDEPLDIRTFCWDQREANERATWAQVLAFNAKKADLQTRVERAEVELTNDYRLMFGHRPLAVNDKLLDAARGHATEMSTLGYFSHFSPTPGRKTPFDRMKNAGYGFGVSENIANHPSAESAHYGWTHSSGHHRNLLMESHREFAVGNDGRYWVQNFGRGDEYRRDPAWTKS